MKNNSMTEVIFKVYASVQFGEELRVSGNVPALGCDNPDRSIPMYTSPTEFPWWHTRDAVFVPGEHNTVNYRYCIFSGGKFNRWEGHGNLKRILHNEDSVNATLAVEDKYGEARFEAQSVPKSPGKVVSESSRSTQSEKYFEWGRKSQVDNKLSQNDGCVIVSYFLPVVLGKSKTGQWTASWDNENVLSLQLEARCIWVGSVRYQNAPIPVDEEENVAAALSHLSCYPVFINQPMHLQFYDMFCKQNLWPIMHQIADVYGPLKQGDISANTQQNLWMVYSTVHNLFRDKILEVFQQGYLIWIHGFHLMLLPSFVRRRIPGAKIGYYLHTPFPSSEIWRTMSRREDLLRGILGADQVGFHLFEYARHFLTVCRRLLGCSFEINASGMMVVNIDGREVAITCIHVGVDLPRLDEIFTRNNFYSDTATYRERWPGKIIVAGISRLERLKGIPLNLMAIDRFITLNPKWIGRIVFTVIGISAAERGQDYRQTQHDVKVLVQQINEKHGQDIVCFEERHERDIRLAQRLVFFAAADILMITATRDGLNRYPMEYSLARKKIGEVTPYLAKQTRLEGGGLVGQGVIIISEFISSARVMRGALAVNPWKIDEVTEALKHSLEMEDQERSDRHRRNLEFSTRLTTANWANHVLHDLKSVAKSDDPNASYAVGFGLHYKVMNLKAGFQPLNVKQVCDAYRGARSRLILLDWGGTLVANSGKNDSMHTYAMAQGHAARESPTQEIKRIVESLCSDMKNIVFVVSGKELPQVSEFFGTFRNLGLGAEHGFYYRWPRDDSAATSHLLSSDAHLTASTASGKGKWQTMTELGDQTWKESAKLVMGIFVQRTHGTYIEQKGNALIWQFRDADPEFGYMQSKELEEHLVSILAPYAVEVIRGGGVADGYIEVRPKGVSKGLFLEHAMNIMRAVGNECDFVMAIGDDISDEPMFERLLRIQQQGGMTPCSAGSSRHNTLHTFGITVGKKPTAANAYLDDPSAVVELLHTLSKTSMREKKYFSAVDLPSQAGGHTSDNNSSGVSSYALLAKQAQYIFGQGSPGQQQQNSTGGSPYGSLVSSSFMSRTKSAGNLSLTKNDSFTTSRSRTVTQSDSRSILGPPVTTTSSGNHSPYASTSGIDGGIGSLSMVGQGILGKPTTLKRQISSNMMDYMNNIKHDDDENEDMGISF